MYRVKEGNLEWLEFDLLADIPHLRHAVFLRHGGQSQGAYNSLNISYDVGDDDKHVTANLATIQGVLQRGLPHDIKIKWAKQIHGKNIATINPHSPQESLNFDALITNSPSLALLVKHADCQAAIMYDPKHHVVANVHAGWRGSVHNIYAETIQRMQKQFGSNPSDLLICISPSLGPDDAEFIHYRNELPEEFWPFQVRPHYFDFWSISEHQLQKAGILRHHIEVAGESTYANPRDYFSYRHNNITGRHGTCVMLV